jgi:hypothetical protein
MDSRSIDVLVMELFLLERTVFGILIPKQSFLYDYINMVNNDVIIKEPN